MNVGTSPRSTKKGITEDAMSNLDLNQHAGVCQVDGREGQEVDMPGGAQGERLEKRVWRLGHRKQFGTARIER